MVVITLITMEKSQQIKTNQSTGDSQSETFQDRDDNIEFINRNYVMLLAV